MMVQLQLAAILFFVINVCSACDHDMAVYKVSMKFLWSEDTFPKDYPLYRPKAQWSPLFGQSHNSSHSIYRVGEVAPEIVRNFAQYGKIEALVEDGDDNPKVYDQFSTPAVGNGIGETENIVFLDHAYTMVSVICRLIPSPDWFVGVDSLNLCVDSSWVDQITLELQPLDAGAASGLTFTAPRWETSPPEPVFRHGPRHPNHPAAGFYYPNVKELPTIAKIGFTKVKEYSTKDQHDLARKELLNNLKLKNKKKGLPRRNIHFEQLIEVSTKSNLEQLKDLEEEPVGTPRINIPDNNVLVVTRPPFISTPNEEFDSDLKNMDDVVLAVAQGRKLGLGKHLPRHFRYRLHHAVNKIQPNDCLVSEWSEWSPCSVTCGFGDKFRTRTVLRQRRGKGRKCPALNDRKHCGNINSCAHIDYFAW